MDRLTRRADQGRTTRLIALMALCWLVGGCAGTDARGGIARVGFGYHGGEQLRRSGTGILGDTNDTIRAHQLAVLRLEPTVAAGDPVIMLPGYGLAADTYLETPDGREGWAMDFVRSGRKVFVVEPSHTTRSGIDTGFYRPGSTSQTRELFSWGGEHVWRRWGLGPSFGQVFADSRFPAGKWHAVVASFTGVEAEKIDGGSQIGFQLEANIRGLRELTDVNGPAVIVLHSASGVAGFTFAQRHPERVRAIVAIEPVGCPSQSLKVPVLTVFGDHLEVREQIALRQEECRKLAESTAADGIAGELWSLSALGIKGNSHLMMMEDNSRELSARISIWLTKAVGKRR